MGDLFYGVIVHLLTYPETHKILVEEIRGSFSNYSDIMPGPTLTALPYLHACIEETLRMLPSNNTGLPRISPGAMVDGQYIPEGVSVVFIFPFPVSTSLRQATASYEILETMRFTKSSA